MSDERHVEVCKVFFIATLPVGWNTTKHVAKTAMGGIAKQDCRGKEPSKFVSLLHTTALLFIFSE